jgi:hypothetical protein
VPCGGVYPIIPATHKNARCWQCGLTAAAKPLDHFCDEWDTYIHRDCIPAFLATDEGRIVLDHGHEVWIAGLGPEAPKEPA